jgi:hypothetical protein
MSSPPERLTPHQVLTILTTLRPQTAPTAHDAPPCEWCHGITVWTTGNKTRCTRCGYVPS